MKLSSSFQSNPLPKCLERAEQLRTLHDVQQDIDRLITKEWHSHYWAPLSNLARLTEEVGELAREINHRYGEKPKKPNEEDGDIATELGDILYIVATLANSVGVDLDEAFNQVMDKYRQRDAQRWKQSQVAVEALDDTTTTEPL
jgi:NTP pyrophosphatase (non-canonical NTP hydrolase)